MHSAPHRNNSDFQLRHFIAGSCHTADAAWNVLYEQMLDIKLKLESTKARILRREAQFITLAEQKNNIQNEADRLNYEASLIEFKSGEGLLELALAGAERELATIKSLMDELEPYRKYKHLPLLEATEAAQQDEWREEFICRVENYILSQGSIPHDQLDAMRKHPDFESSILPHIKKTFIALESANNTSNAVMLLKNNNFLIGREQNDDRT